MQVAARCQQDPDHLRAALARAMRTGTCRCHPTHPRVARPRRPRSSRSGCSSTAGTRRRRSVRGAVHRCGDARRVPRARVDDTSAATRSTRPIPRRPTCSPGSISNLTRRVHSIPRSRSVISSRAPRNVELTRAARRTAIVRPMSVTAQVDRGGSRRRSRVGCGGAVARVDRGSRRGEVNDCSLRGHPDGGDIRRRPRASPLRVEAARARSREARGVHPRREGCRPRCAAT